MGEDMLRFKWFGQACFEISNSVSIVTDPHDGDSVGLETPGAEGDFITVSHDHYDHASGVDLISNPGTTVVKSLGDDAEEINLRSFKSYHDRSEGQARGDNIIFKFEVDGVKICHLGDLGHKLSPEKVQEIRPIDVLLIPVGGKFTIDGSEAAETVRDIQSKVVIPMHYSVEGLEVPISGPEQFLRSIKDDYNVKEMEELELEEVPEENTVCVLDCKA